MSSTTTTSKPKLPKITNNQDPSGLRYQTHIFKNNMYVPLFRMGCPGDPESMITYEVFKTGGKLDLKFWAQFAKIIESNGIFDWDWEGCVKNIIEPNKEHIRLACKIKDDRILERFIQDGYVFLNDWYRDADEDEGEDPKTFPNRVTCFTSLECDY